MKMLNLMMKLNAEVSRLDTKKIVREAAISAVYEGYQHWKKVLCQGYNNSLLDCYQQLYKVGRESRLPNITHLMLFPSKSY
jgi:hypothetical protein